jgi:hypothetical protein
LLIFMGTALFSTLLGMATGLDFSGTWAGLLVLMPTAFITGLIAGLARKERGPATALTAGLTAALIFMVLWLAARPDDAYNPLLFGLPGMLLAILCCVPGGMLGARMRGTS